MKLLRIWHVEITKQEKALLQPDVVALTGAPHSGVSLERILLPLAASE